MKLLIATSAFLFFISAFSFPTLNLVLKPGFGFYTEGAGYNGTAGIKFYFNPTLAFLPQGLYAGANGFFENISTKTYTYYLRGAAADIGFSIPFAGKYHVFTPHVTAGFGVATLSGSFITNADLPGFYGEAALEYEAMVSDQFGIGLDVGYHFFFSQATLINPFIKLSIDLKLL